MVVVVNDERAVENAECGAVGLKKAHVGDRHVDRTGLDLLDYLDIGAKRAAGMVVEADLAFGCLFYCGHPIVDHLVVGLGKSVCMGIDDLDRLDLIPAGSLIAGLCFFWLVGAAACAQGKHHYESQKQC